MSVFLFVIELYFAAMLGVAGLAKFDDPAHFARALRRHSWVPAWGIATATYVVPPVEVTAAALLLTGKAPIPTATLVLLLFTGFLAAQIALAVSRRVGDCGCFGAAYRHDINAGSIAAAVVLVGLAGFHLWGTTQAAPLTGPVRLASLGAFGSVGCWLAAAITRRRLARCPHCGLRHPVASGTLATGTTHPRSN